MAENTKSQPKVVIFDLETLPNLQEALKVWPQLSNYPGLTLRASINTIACAGWKIYGEEKTHCIHAWDYPSWQEDVNDDYCLVKDLYEVLKDADAVITHNGAKFDWKFLQTRLMFHKISLLPSIAHIDTKQLASRNLFSFNNKLDTLGEWMVGDRKLENGGWQLWVDVHSRKKSAMKLMSEYCMQDVDLLEKVYKRLIPFVKNHPNMNLWVKDRVRVCPNCGHNKLSSRGWRYSKTGKFRRYVCRNCGSPSRGDKKELNLRSI